MRLSAKAEYACLAVLGLALHRDLRQPLTVKALAEAHGIPQRYLVQILLQLKGAGYVTSVRGAGGGYRLALPPEKLSLADVMTAIDGPFPSRHEPAALPRSPLTQVLCRVWNEMLAAQRQALQDVTFADLMKRVSHTVGDMYYI